MEGVAAEAASLAGTLRLGKLIYLYDDNEISIEGSTDIAFTEQVGRRFEAYDWHVQRVDGNDVDAVATAINTARAHAERPSLIMARTVIGFGSPHAAGTAQVHGAPLGEEEIRLTKRALGWPEQPPFHVPDEAFGEFRKALNRGRAWEEEWNGRFASYEAAFPDDARLWRVVSAGELPENWDAAVPTFTSADGPMATRQASGKVLNGLIEGLPTLLGGSADLAPSTNTYLKGYGDLGFDEWCGHNMHFGVREHAMGNIANGMALHGGVIPYTATFLVFSDYMRPALRLAALQRAHVIFIFTHDSIGMGEDGPTHQPVEHLASLRAMPDFTLFRPADANETAECWRLAVARPGPVAIVLSRQSLPVFDDIKRIRDGVRRGAYVFADADAASPDLVLLASGSEVSLVLAARTLLGERGIQARVVSMPSWDLFEEQPQAYKNAVIPSGVRARLAVEAASPLGWHRYVGDAGDIVALAHFGASAPADQLFQAFGFTPEQVANRAAALVGQPARQGA